MADSTTAKSFFRDAVCSFSHRIAMSRSVKFSGKSGGASVIVASRATVLFGRTRAEKNKPLVFRITAAVPRNSTTATALQHVVGRIRHDGRHCHHGRFAAAD